MSAAAAPTSGAAAPLQRVHVDAGADAALAAVAAAAEDWAAGWEANAGGGRLHLPVQAGLRHGRLAIAVSASAVARGTDLTFAVDDSTWTIHRTAAGLLVIAGLGAFAALLWPFVPAVAPLAPMGVVLAIGAWLVVLSRLRHRGLAEFVDDVADRLEPATAGEPAA